MQGLPWRSSGWDTMLPLQGAWVQALVRELGSHMPPGAAKKKKRNAHSQVPPTDRQTYRFRNSGAGLSLLGFTKPSRTLHAAQVQEHCWS